MGIEVETTTAETAATAAVRTAAAAETVAAGALAAAAATAKEKQKYPIASHNIGGGVGGVSESAVVQIFHARNIPGIFSPSVNGFVIVGVVMIIVIGRLRA